MTSYLVTGASRGIGLAFVHKLASLPSTSVVLATARSPASATDLQALADKHPEKVHILTLDITNVEQTAALAASVDSLLPNGLDVLINNAGVRQPPCSVTAVTANLLTEQLATNTLGTNNVLNALLPALRRGTNKLVVTISSYLGSMTNNIRAYPFPAYAVSKTALNALIQYYAVELQKEGFRFQLFHPGYVKTDIGGQYATETPQESVEGILKQSELDAKKKRDGDQRAVFLDWQGDVLPW